MTPDQLPSDEGPTLIQSAKDQPAVPIPSTGFIPGTILMRRYRIVSLIGTGGMGEVYRADDMKLGQAVALKFLPQQMARSGADLLLGEVRMGRQIAHPNVCRLYDIIEADDHHFIAMEYVDGEDLASLLRRIGRLPAEKALRVARDLCSGLAAAHERGVIHRDLKPANIMIDARGTAKITDFGIAAIADDESTPAFLGTPSYMAPEQLRGEQLSPRTDLYALGLVLYELFTGKRIFDGVSLGELLTAHKRRKPRLSTIVVDVDPSVERVILQCLEEDPLQRPSSAQRVLAMLPGDDPIAAALAAGDTPPPEIVAASGAAGQVSRRTAWVLLGTTAVTLAMVLWLTPRTMLYARVPIEMSPDVLSHRATEVLRKLGCDPGARGVSWFRRDDAYLRWLARTDDSPGVWRRLSITPPSAIAFVYYALPASYIPENATGKLELEPAVVREQFANVVLDGRGALREFRAPARAPAFPPSWPALFHEAGLDNAAFLPVAMTSSSPYEQTLVWKIKSAPGDPVPLLVEASLRQGRLASFAVTGAWNRTASAPEESRFAAEMGLSSTWVGGSLIGAMTLIAIVAAVLARRNVLRRRVDRSGALKIALYAFFVEIAAWTCSANHVANLEREWEMVVTGISGVAFKAGFIWLAYLALEPPVRRRWPHTLVSWMRLLFGRVGDPLVGRDVLIGVVAGIGWNVFWRIINIAPAWFGIAPLIPYGSNWEAFGSLRGTASRFFTLQGTAIMFSLGTVIILLFWRLVTRSAAAGAIAAAATVALVTYQSVGWHAVGLDHVYFPIFFEAIAGAGVIFLAIRFGVLSLALAIFVHFGLCAYPLTTSLSSWYAGRSVVALLFIVTLAAYGAATAVGSQRLFTLPED